MKELKNAPKSTHTLLGELVTINAASLNVRVVRDSMNVGIESINYGLKRRDDLQNGKVWSRTLTRRTVLLLPRVGGSVGGLQENTGRSLGAC